MTRNTMKSICFISFLFACLFSMSSSFARQSESITLTTEEIRSSEDCAEPNKESIALNCKSYHQTTNYTCGPAAIMTLMSYYGKLSPREMNRTTEMRIAAEMGAKTGDDGGTTESQVENWLSGHGFSVDSGQRVTTDLIVDNLKRGTPTLVGFSRHWIVAKGFRKGATSEKDEIVFADSCCNVTVISRDTIDYMWLNSQRPANHCRDNVGIYIVAKPK
ncbi:MAG: peptidase C39 family protein [Gammaproteobacteria bacterium]|nr:peptidase C39 family protein [Gammaproteobacteria bacterium]